MAEDKSAPEPVEGPHGGTASERAQEIIQEFPALCRCLAESWQRLQAIAPDLEYRPLDDRLEIVVPVDMLVGLCGTLRDELGYAMLMSITAVDKPTRFDLLYHLYRLDAPCPVVLRCRLHDKEHPEAPSIVQLWAGADFQEREIYDLMGIVFTGHPNLRRILLDDDFPGHPLRKDFQIDPDYVLVRSLRVPGYPGAQAGSASAGRFFSEKVPADG